MFQSLRDGRDRRKKLLAQACSPTFVPLGGVSGLFLGEGRELHTGHRRSIRARLPFGAGWAPNPRQEGDLGAMHAAYASGHVFTGDADIPLIDLRPYLEPKLNMHNVWQSFSARLRMQRKGHGRNQVIWFTGSEANIPARVGDALALLDAWLTTGKRPARFVDQCTDAGRHEALI